MFLSFPHLYTEFIGPGVARTLQKNMTEAFMLFKWILLSYLLTLILFKRFGKICEIHPFCLIFIANSACTWDHKAQIVAHVLNRGNLYKASIIK